MALVAVTLDAAGTLFVVREPVGETYARVAAAYGIALDAPAAGVRFRAALRAAAPLVFPGVPAQRRAEAERGWWRSVVRTTFGDAADAPRFERCFEELYAHYARPEAWALADGSHKTLRALRAAGLRLGVVSNFDARLHGLVAGLGIASLLDAVVASAAHDAAKPDPRLFHAAARLLGVRPTDVLHVGDDLETDVHGALAAGCRAMLLASGDAPAPPGVPILLRLRDLPDALRHYGFSG